MFTFSAVKNVAVEPQTDRDGKSGPRLLLVKAENLETRSLLLTATRDVITQQEVLSHALKTPLTFRNAVLKRYLKEIVYLSFPFLCLSFLLRHCESSLLRTLKSACVQCGFG